MTPPERPGRAEAHQPDRAARFVGQRVARREDARLLSGQGHFVDDVRRPAMAHVAFVRSPHAHARIVSLDATEALALDGVEAVLTASALAQVRAPTTTPPGEPHDRPLADGEVRFVGDPVAIVVAASRALAEDALERVVVEYEVLPAVVGIDAALAGGPLVHPELGVNVVGGRARADATVSDFARATHVVTESVSQHRYLPVPMETRGLVAEWQSASGEMTVWIATQGAHPARDRFAAELGLPASRVRVIVGDVGGAFGLKIWVGREEVAVVLAARLLARPLRWIEDRWENLVAGHHAREERATVSLALDAEANILALRMDHVVDVGSYAAAAFGLERFVCGPYRIGSVSADTRTAYTNTMRRGAYRGPWMFETVVRELLVDAAARHLGMDPLELRRRNVVSARDLPFRTAAADLYEDVDCAATLEQAAEIIDYEGFRSAQAQARSDGRLVGLGIACFVEPSASGFGLGASEAVNIRIEPDGQVLAITGANSQGHSLETTMAQVIADHLGVHVDAVAVRFGDTASSPVGATTGGSRNAVFAGGAARQAALEMRARVLVLAGHLMEAEPADLELTDAVVSVRGTPSRSMSLREIASASYLDARRIPAEIGPGLELTTRFTTPGPTFSACTHMCTCEIDPATGVVTIDRYVVSEDCGVLINPTVVEGQIDGGVTQGIGGALLENFVYDERGNPLTTTLADYLLPTAWDVPIYEHGHIETASQRPGGFRGMGEGGAIGAPAAVLNAVNDALAPRGVRLTDQPLTPDRVLAALDAAATNTGQIIPD